MTRNNGVPLALVVTLLLGPLAADAVAGSWSFLDPLAARSACEDGCDGADSRPTCCSSWKCRWDRWCRRSRGIETCHPEAPPICHPTFGYHETCWRWLPHPPPCPVSAASGWPRLDDARPVLDGTASQRRESDQPPVPPPAR